MLCENHRLGRWFGVAYGGNMLSAAVFFSSFSFFFIVKPNKKRNRDSKNKNGTVEYLRREVFYGKERIKEIQKHHKTRIEYTGSFPYTQNRADDDLSPVEETKRNRRYSSREHR